MKNVAVVEEMIMDLVEAAVIEEKNVLVDQIVQMTVLEEAIDIPVVVAEEEVLLLVVAVKSHI